MFRALGALGAVDARIGDPPAGSVNFSPMPKLMFVTVPTDVVLNKDGSFTTSNPHDGLHVKSTAVGAEASFKLGDGWTVEERFRKSAEVLPSVLTRLLASAITIMRSEAAATIFSRKSAPPDASPSAPSMRYARFCRVSGRRGRRREPPRCNTGEVSPPPASVNARELAMARARSTLKPVSAPSSSW